MVTYNFTNLTKIYKNCRNFATTEPVSHTATARSRNQLQQKKSGWDEKILISASIGTGMVTVLKQF